MQTSKMKVALKKWAKRALNAAFAFINCTKHHYLDDLKIVLHLGFCYIASDYIGVCCKNIDSVGIMVQKFSCGKVLKPFKV